MSMSTVICSSCNQPGHLCHSHRDCLNNPRRLATRAQNEAVFVEEHERHANIEVESESVNSVEGSDVQSDVQSNQPRCYSCGEYGHSRRSHRTCCLNPANNGNELDNENTNISVNKNCARVSCNIIPERHSLGRMDQQCSQYYAYMWIEERASHSSVRNPVFNLCCHQGRVQLPQLRRTPVEISTLLRGSGARSNKFHRNIRAYNSTLSFTSLGVNVDQSVVNSRNGAYNFRIHSAVHHRIGSLFPNNNTATPAFAQIYVHDPTTELQSRQAVASASLNSETLQQLQISCTE
ncbi:hypothetical protein INT45_013595 [Circinella minor]|uniref:CCHC-type domain-containing protein n=1 Tax=Circinella minor TaxID=1195481 RepID=A0A8H7RI27_9FUNG|nr:hypothetical protein INT45_013595 [Circinella minor]